MKNKKNTYILLTAVLLVWSILGYRIFSTVNPNKEKRQTVIASNSFKPQLVKESETFTINTDYRDPFLDKLSKKKVVKAKKVIRTTRKTPKTPFPAIIYKGLVSSKRKQQQVFLINIDGQQYFFKKNNTHKEVKLLRGSNKQVVLRFQGQQQSFSIAK
ncbi:MAG: hypothetical protein L3J20_01745 [Flavobacteriaceae bacterium]|nr:hypothetical protein [Flavobacteriaceae bacterium]